MKYRPATCEHGALLTEDCDDCWSGPTGYVKPAVEPQANEAEHPVEQSIDLLEQQQ